MNRKGVERIKIAFGQARAAGRAAFMPYYVVGYPNLASSIDILQTLAQSGADLIEVGVPFSDPVADGPTNQIAAQMALKNGISLADVLEAVHKLRRRAIDIPMVLMGYYNPFLAYGIEALCRDAAAAGIDGIIIPDLPPDVRDGQAMINYCREHGLAFVPLLAPTSTEKRIRIVVQAATGFVYLVSVTGITGARDQLPADLATFVTRVRQFTDMPLAVGFGIATPAHAAQVAQIADGVVVGSALVKLAREEQAVTRIRELATALAGSMRLPLHHTT